jgi:hypothetical protein
LAARKSVPALVGWAALTLAAGLICVLGAGLPGRFSPELRPYLTYTYSFSGYARVGRCWLGKDDAADGFAPACVDPPEAGKHLVLLWGDSHAALFYPALRTVDQGRNRFAEFTRNSCPPVFDAGLYAWCSASNDFVASRIQALKPDTVILFSHWTEYLSTDPADPKLHKLEATVARLKRAGAGRILVMGPAPNWKDKLPEDLVRQAIYRHDYVMPRRNTWMLQTEPRTVDLLMARQLSGMPGVSYFSAYDALCDDSGCLTTLDGSPEGLTSFDYGHLTLAGANYLAQKLVQETGYPDLK